MKGKAKVKKFRGDKRMVGDSLVPGVVVWLDFVAVKLEHAREFVAQLDLLFDEDDKPALTEIERFDVTREVANVECSIGDVMIKGADLTDVVVRPVNGKKCDVSLQVSAQASGCLDVLHGHLGESVLVVLTERQFSLHKLEGGVAPEPGAAA